MPWTTVNNIAPPVHSGTVIGNTATISVGDKNAGDIYDVELTFAPGTVTDNFAFRATVLTQIEVVHLSVKASENKATVRFKTLNDGLSVAQFRFTFGDALYETSPNIQITTIDV